MEQFYRGVEVVMHTATLIAQHNEQLQAANAASTERNSRKRERIQEGGTFSQEEAQDPMAENEALALAKVVRHEEEDAAGAARRWTQVCKQCSKPGHNKYACTNDSSTSDE
jgi:hypothetical protein